MTLATSKAQVVKAQADKAQEETEHRYWPSGAIFRQVSEEGDEFELLAVIPTTTTASAKKAAAEGRRSAGRRTSSSSRASRL